MRYLGYFCIFLVLAFGLTFSILNANPVVVNYYVGTRSLPLSLLLAFALVIGALLGLLVGLFLYLKLKVENSRLRSRAKVAEQEVENLRAIPLQGDR